MKWIALFFSISCWALPLQNPSDASHLPDSLLLPSWLLSARVGFYGDYVYNRHLEVDLPGNPSIRKTEIFTNAGYLALNACNRLDLFWTFGASNLNMTLDQSLFGPVAGQEEIFSDTEFSWSVGLRATLLRLCGVTLGFEAQYFYFRPYLDNIIIVGVEATFPFIQEIYFRYQEWQVGPGLSYCIDMGTAALVSYIGYRYAEAKLDFFNQNFVSGSITFDVERTRLDNARTHGGYAVGLTLIGCNQGSVTAEARFVDEKAFHVNMQLRL